MINMMRKTLGITQEELALVLDCSKVRVSRIIGKNPRTASYDELVTMYNYLQAKKSKISPTLTIKQLLSTRSEVRKLVYVTLQEDVTKVIRKMKEHDFSQLPVFNQQGTCLGIISEHGIVRKTHQYGLELKKLKLIDIQEVLEIVPTISYHSKFIEALLMLDLYYAVLLESQNKIVDILTRNDVLHFFSEEITSEVSPIKDYKNGDNDLD